MNLPVNRSSESPQSSKETPPEPLSGATQPPLTQSTESEAVESITAESTDEIKRQQPIPPPSHPRQYRAIGLVYGQYQRSEEQLTQGMIQTPGGSAIDAVILGRVISLLKNHLDLEKPHLWVVYPRTRQENDDLHVQIVGVWEPETLNQEQSEDGEDKLSAISTSAEPGYFSIRGEVIFSDQYKQTVIIKIRQSPKKEIDKPKFFKLKLFGTLPSKPVSRFWDLQVSLRGDTLIIQEGLDLGFATKKKPFRQGGGGGYSKPFDRRRTSEYDSRSSSQEQEGEKRRPIPKPSFNKDNQPMES